MDNSAYPPPPQPAMADSAYPPAGPPAYPPAGPQKQAPPPNFSNQPPPYGTSSGYTGQPQYHMGATVHPVGSVGYATTANTVVITQPGVGGYVSYVYPDNSGAIIFSCVVAWCCCCVLGIIAFVYAIQSAGSATAEQATRNLMVSQRLSMSGLITGIFLWIFWIIIIIIA